MPEKGLLIFLFVSLLLMRPFIAALYVVFQVLAARLLAPGNRIRAFLGSYGEPKGLHLQWGKLEMWWSAWTLILPGCHVDFSAGPPVPARRQVMIILAGSLGLLLLSGVAVALLLLGRDWGMMRFAAAIFVGLTALHLLRILLAKMDHVPWEGFGLVTGDGERLSLLFRYGKAAPQMQRLIWHWAKDDYGMVLRELELLQEQGDLHPLLYDYAIYACLQEGRIAEGKRLCLELRKKKPLEPIHWVMMSYFHELAGETEAARKTVESALQHAPGFHLALNQRAHLHLMEDRRPEALRDLDRAIRSDPEFAAAYGNRARVHLRQKNHPLAQKDLEKSLEIDPMNPQNHRTLSELLLQTGQRQAAQEARATALVLSGVAPVRPSPDPSTP